VRLDVFLKLSRLCARRTVAQQLCDAGVVLLNGRTAKAGHTIKTEDKIIIRRRDHEMVVRVLSVPATRNVSRSDSSQLVEVVSETRLDPLGE
jgi:ribosomal 50S subunit-recycling heat shock protein